MITFCLTQFHVTISTKYLLHDLLDNEFTPFLENKNDWTNWPEVVTTTLPESGPISTVISILALISR